MSCVAPERHKIKSSYCMSHDIVQPIQCFLIKYLKRINFRSVCYTERANSSIKDYVFTMDLPDCEKTGCLI